MTTNGGGSNTDKDFRSDRGLHLVPGRGHQRLGLHHLHNDREPQRLGCHAQLTYMDPNPASGGRGGWHPHDVTLPPLSQTTVSSASDIGQVDFSTKVECLEGKTIAVDRTMFWTGAGCSPAQTGYHSSIGTTSPSKTWYLPEGSSNWGFETWTAVLNPNDTEANDHPHLHDRRLGPKAVNKTVPANSRATYNMASDIGAADASIKVTATSPWWPSAAHVPQQPPRGLLLHRGHYARHRLLPGRRGDRLRRGLHHLRAGPEPQRHRSRQ